MRLLIITQKVDRRDPVLGFFHGWIREFSTKFESIKTICLYEGQHNLPDNVRVFSLGKETVNSRLRYIFRFYSYLWKYRKDYDAVFVHMNQEYVLLAGCLWRLIGKKVFMWRNHPVGNIWTRLAVFLCNKVFCTSKYSFTAKYKKTMLMPVGVDSDLFKLNRSLENNKGSLLSLGRISSSKNIHIMIEAFDLLKNAGVGFNVTIYGDALPKDSVYLEHCKSMLRDLNLTDQVVFCKGVPNEETPKIYASNEIFINLSSSGMYDKTIFEAMSCGCLVLVSNDNLIGNIDNIQIINNKEVKDIADRLIDLICLSETRKGDIIRGNIIFTEKHSLKNLVNEIVKIIR